MTAKKLIEQLQLVRHPEGGWYRESYRSGITLPREALPASFGGDRSSCTAIYFLLEQGDISALHRIQSDELWFFHCGSLLRIHCIAPDGGYQALYLGEDSTDGCCYQVMMPAGCWFGAEVVGEGFVLVSCTVAPGFDFADFELGNREELLRCYPAHGELITRMAR